MSAPFSLQADWNLLARPVSDEVFAQVARDRWPACLREIERLTGQLDVVRAERDQAQRDPEVRKLEDQIVEAVLEICDEGYSVGPRLVVLVVELEAARAAAAAKIGGGP